MSESRFDLFCCGRFWHFKRCKTEFLEEANKWSGNDFSGRTCVSMAERLIKWSHFLVFIIIIIVGITIPVWWKWSGFGGFRNPSHVLFLSWCFYLSRNQLNPTWNDSKYVVHLEAIKLIIMIPNEIISEKLKRVDDCGMSVFCLSGLAVFAHITQTNETFYYRSNMN